MGMDCSEQGDDEEVRYDEGEEEGEVQDDEHDE